jgi:hypothetical protein
VKSCALIVIDDVLQNVGDEFGIDFETVNSCSESWSIRPRKKMQTIHADTNTSVADTFPAEWANESLVAA